LEEDRFSIVRCVGDDPALHTYFLRVAAVLLMELGVYPSSTSVSRAIDRLIELFRAMARAPRKSVRGLWGELYLIAQAPDPTLLVSAWHALPEDLYDFNMGSQRIEVKSASNRIREHHFSLDQLHPPDGTKVVVASLFVERAGAGTSATDLIDQVRGLVGSNSNLLSHIDQIVGLTLGADWRHAAEDRFDRETANSSLSFYASDTIPKVSTALPAAVSAVHFRLRLLTHLFCGQ
jgi:hypothetical protein